MIVGFKRVLKSSVRASMGEERRPSNFHIVKFCKYEYMTGKKKGKQVSELRQQGTDSLNVKKGISGTGKAPGQVGLYGPQNLDSVRRAKPDERRDTGERVFGGISQPQVADQTYDCYKPARKVNPPKKNKK